MGQLHKKYCAQYRQQQGAANDQANTPPHSQTEHRYHDHYGQHQIDDKVVNGVIDYQMLLINRMQGNP